MLKIYSGRHANATPGETDLERQISETGKEQAIKMAKKLSGIEFDFVFSSPAKRSQMTAEIIAPGKDIVVIPALYPTSAEMDEMFAELKYAPLSEYQKHKHHEVIYEMHYSQWAGINEAMKSVGLRFNHDANLLILSHAVIANIITNFYENGLISVNTSLKEAELIKINFFNLQAKHITL